MLGNLLALLVPRAKLVPAVRPEDMSQDPDAVSGCRQSADTGAHAPKHDRITQYSFSSKRHLRTLRASVQ